MFKNAIDWIKTRLNLPVYPDNCEVCKGAKGGIRGNELIINGRVVCDYCHADGSAKTPPQHQFGIGNFKDFNWSLHWTRCDFDKQLFQMHGWIQDYSQWPKVGNIVKCEMQKTWCWFEVTEVDPCGDPKDMFFVKVKPIYQEVKDQ